MYWQLQRPNKDSNVQVKERSKVLKVRQRGYIAPSSETILSLMNFFSVPKVTVYHEDTGRTRFWKFGWFTMGRVVGSTRSSGHLGLRCLLENK
jgi:hypothetical protein